jgi:four helix bundle protein
MTSEKCPTDITEPAFLFACRVVRLCDLLMRRGGVAALIGRELAKAGTSTGANLQEARGGQTKPDFITKNCIALKEARESWFWLRVAEATIAPLPPDTSPLRAEADELVAILTTIVKNARSGHQGR